MKRNTRNRKVDEIKKIVQENLKWGAVFDKNKLSKNYLLKWFIAAASMLKISHATPGRHNL